MRFSQIIQDIDGTLVGTGDPVVQGIVSDHRLVKPGDIFVAQCGKTVDGHQFIPQALSNGAVAICGTADIEGLAAPYWKVADSRAGLAALAAAFYGHPAHELAMLGVTGTDGKTTTVTLIYHILQAAGIAVGMISTVNARIGEEVIDTGFHVTTPEAPEIQRFLRKMVDAGIAAAVLETTSHGLEQQRVAQCEFDLGVVTNITHEHLDFHGGFEGYRAAKARLFQQLGQSVKERVQQPVGAVLNRDDASFDYLRQASAEQVISYGIEAQADFRAVNLRTTRRGMEFEVLASTFPGGVLRVATPLFGNYNVSNILAALAATVGGMGVSSEAAVKGVAAMKGIDGRMERIEMGQDFSAIVDFAHTPNALRKVLETARCMAGGQEKAGRVLAIFGSAGLRDREKRRMMAEVSAELADFTILTAEDPRSESLDEILQEMELGIKARSGIEAKNYAVVADRGAAIQLGVQMAQAGDIVLACGKGHEQSMCFGNTEYAWDDRTAMRAALAQRLGVFGPAMPYLPTRG